MSERRTPRTKGSNANPADEVLDRVTDLLRYARFESDELPECAERLKPLLRDAAKRKRSAPSDGANTLRLLRAACLQCEIYDYLADYDAAEKAIQLVAADARTAVEQIQEIGGDMEVRLLRQRLWALTHHAQNRYRRFRFTEAIGILQQAEETLNRLLPLEGHRSQAQGQPSYGLRSRISYLMGSAQLRLGQILEARTAFTRAMDHQYKRLDAKLDKYSSGARRSRELEHASYQTGMILGLGLGWCSLLQGEILRAKASLAGARSLLRRTGDSINLGLLDIFYARALRASSKYGTFDSDLGHAIELLRKVTEEGSSVRHHRPHYLRALFELAIALMDTLTQEHLEEAESIIRILSDQSAHEARWQARAGLLRCRALRMRVNPEYEEARQIAEALLVHPGYKEQGTIAARTHMELAQAMIELEDFGHAESHLQKALNLVKGNHLDTAVCQLHMARLFARQRKQAYAETAFAKWTALSEEIEHGYASYLAGRVREEIDKCDPSFRWSGAGDKLDYSEIHEELKLWLIKRAYEHCGESFTGAEHFLGVSRATIVKWRRELNFKPGDMRRTSTRRRDR